MHKKRASNSINMTYSTFTKLTGFPRGAVFGVLAVVQKRREARK